MRSSLAAAMVLMAWIHPARAEAPKEPSPWEITLAGDVGFPGGWVKVGENDVPGTRLHLHGDLGIDTSESFTLGVAYHLDSQSSIRLSVQSLFLEGSKTLGSDVFFNGTTLQGGTRLETRTGFPDFLRAGVRYEHRLAALGERGDLYGGAGFDYVLLTFRVKGTLASSSKGSETKEDFLTQELPVPMLAARGEYPLADRLQATFSLAGGYLPRVDSLRNEGGDVKLNQAEADAGVGLAFDFRPDLRGEIGYQYTYFFQLEKSGEDDNVILLSDHGLRVALSYRF